MKHSHFSFFFRLSFISLLLLFSVGSRSILKISQDRNDEVHYAYNGDIPTTVAWTSRATQFEKGVHSLDIPSIDELSYRLLRKHLKATNTYPTRTLLSRYLLRPHQPRAPPHYKV